MFLFWTFWFRPRPTTAARRQQLEPPCRTRVKRRRASSSVSRGSGSILFVLLFCTSLTSAGDQQADKAAGDERPFPTAATTGVPAGWVPKTTFTQSLRVTEVGSVIEDVRILGDLLIDAENVTIRRVEIEGGRIRNDPLGVCRNGLVLEDVSVMRAPGPLTPAVDPPAIGPGGYTARRTKIDGLPEGFRIGGKGGGCGPVVIEDSFARIVAPDPCGDWHGDGLQGYDGSALTVRNVTLELIGRPDCGGTAPFFYPADQGNTSVDIDRLLVKGGGYAFRLGMPGRVRGLRIIDRSWDYGPIDVDCSIVEEWDAIIISEEKNLRSGRVRADQCPR